MTHEDGDFLKAQDIGRGHDPGPTTDIEQYSGGLASSTFPIIYG